MHWLLDHGARVDVVDDAGQTPLILAAAKGHLHTAEVLLDRGADINHQDIDGRTPLIAASESGRLETVQ